jgi:xanthine dehydrogenase accessory factor
VLHELAAAASQWLASGREIVLVRGVETWGFGSRNTDEVLLVDDLGHMLGRVGGQSASGRIRDDLGATMVGDSPCGACFVTAEVSSREATAEGLTCGGTVRAIAQRLDHAPSLLWDMLLRGEPVVLATTAAPSDDAPPWFVVSAGRTAGDAALLGGEEEAAATARAFLAAGTPDRRIVPVAGTEMLVELFAPTPRLLVVGRGELADALGQQGRLLGWDVTDTERGDEALGRIADLGSGDALVVLSHDAAIDAPAIAAALERRVGYIGALGSRRTQEARRQRLTDRDVAADAIATIFGPVGLDLGARTPAETALSVCAEIVAHRSGRSGAPLRSQDGPIHLQPST